MQKKEKEFIQLHCTNCNFKIITNGSDIKLVPISYAQPPSRANGKSTETHSLGKRYKCPECGYVIRGFRLQQEVKQTKPEERKISIDERLHKPPSTDDFMKEIDKSMRGMPNDFPRNR